MIGTVVLFLDLFEEQDGGKELERLIEQVKDISTVFIRVKDALDEGFIFEDIDEELVEVRLDSVEKRKERRETSIVVMSDVLESCDL